MRKNCDDDVYTEDERYACDPERDSDDVSMCCSDTSDADMSYTEPQSDKKNENNKNSNKYTNLQAHKNSQHKPPTTLNHEKKTANKASTSTVSGKRQMEEVEDYSFFFESEENSLEEDAEDFDDEDYEEFEDDEKENEPPAKFVKMNTPTPEKCNVRSTWRGTLQLQLLRIYKRLRLCDRHF